MAVEKEAPIPNICAASAACRKALEAAVTEFTETCAAVPVATIKKRLKNADIGTSFTKVEGLEQGRNKRSGTQSRNKRPRQ